MTMQSSTYPETSVPPARRPSADGRSTTETIEAAAREIMETGRTRVTEWKGGLLDGIREKPVQSVLIATVVGAFFSLILRRGGR